MYTSLNKSIYFTIEALPLFCKSDKIIVISTRKEIHFVQQVDEYIALRLKDLCEAHGMTRYRLTQKTGLTQSALKSIFSGKSIPTISTLEKITNALERV